MTDYRQALIQELEARVQKNPRYSIRAFALHLGLSAGALSQILAGRRSISLKVINRILEKVEFSPEQKKHFILSVIEEKKRSGKQKINQQLFWEAVQLSNASDPMKGQVLAARQIDESEFNLVQNWHHFAVLELVNKRDFSPNPKWIAKKLGITHTEASLSFQLLQRLNLIEQVNRRWRKRNQVVDTKDKNRSTLAHRRRQKQILEKSMISIDRDPLSIRNHSSITLCLDESKIAECKSRIQKFMWELNQYLTEGKQERVYELSVQLFPLEQKDLK